MGDFNINILNYNDKLAKNVVNLFYSYSFFSTIIKSTRVTRDTAPLIDHIWTNNYDNLTKSGIIFNSTTDHFPVFSQFSLLTNDLTNYTTVIRIKFTTESISAFKTDLSEWHCDSSNSSVNDVFDKFMDNALDLYNKHFPTITTKINEKYLSKPYITTDIKQSIKHRNRLQKIYAKWALTYESNYKKYRNHVTSLIRVAKEQNYENKLIELTGDTKKTWQTINSLLSKK